MSKNPATNKSRCKRAREAYNRARKHKYALGAFNIDNQETLLAICRALKAQKAPAMVEVSQGEVEALGLHNVRDMVDNYIQEFGIELYINLDHSPSVEACHKAIDAGYEFVHIDISQAKRDAKPKEIIEGTKEVVKYARKTGAIIESEPHYFGGSSNVHKEKIDYEEIKRWFTVPEEATEFMKITGIDTFAVAVGNLHGKYPVPKKLDIGLLKKIRKAVPGGTWLSLHGGSGTPAYYYKEAVKRGISKININSDMRYAFRTALEHELDDNPDEYAVVKLMGPVEDAIQDVVERKLKLFGAVGKAKA